MSIVTLGLDNNLIALLEEQQHQPISDAAQLPGIPRYGFIQRASQLDIPYFRLTAEELQNEVRQSESL